MGLFQKYAAPTCKQVKSALTRAGFAFARQKGSHEHWTKLESGKKSLVTVDCPKAPFSPILVSSMAKQAGLSKNEFLKLCHTKDYVISKVDSLSAASED